LREVGVAMTKSELVDVVAGKVDKIAKKDVEVIVDVVFASITDALCRDERVEIRGWGSFTPRVRDAREGRNPKTGEPVRIPQKRVPLFNVGKELKERVDAAFRTSASK